ncbi:MAG TPA: PEGA domain-containing protein [Myxococcota bacterium]|nr:PEGA domain-containing protein [Myxococcota bacterium]
MRSARSSFCLLVIFLTAPVMAGPGGMKRTASQTPTQTLAVWDLRILGLEAERARRVRYELSMAVKRLPGFRLLDEKKARARLHAKQVPSDASLDKTARALGVHWLLSGTLGGLGDQITLDMRLLDGKTGAQLRKAAISLPLSTNELRSALDEILVRLLVPTRWVGFLSLDVSETGAIVNLDGQQVATTPLSKPIAGLAPGKHILRITKQGYGEFSKFVVIRFNQLARLKVDLKNAMVVGLLYERKRPKLPVEDDKKKPSTVKVKARSSSNTLRKVMAWTFLGLGAGLAGTGVALGVTTKRPVMTSIFSASGGVLLAGSLILFLVKSGSRPSAERPDAPEFTLLPGHGPSGGLGLILSGRF